MSYGAQSESRDRMKEFDQGVRPVMNKDETATRQDNRAASH